MQSLTHPSYTFVTSTDTSGTICPTLWLYTRKLIEEQHILPSSYWPNIKVQAEKYPYPTLEVTNLT